MVHACSAELPLLSFCPHKVARWIVFALVSCYTLKKNYFLHPCQSTFHPIGLTHSHTHTHTLSLHSCYCSSSPSARTTTLLGWPSTFKWQCSLWYLSPSIPISEILHTFLDPWQERHFHNITLIFLTMIVRIRFMSSFSPKHQIEQQQQQHQ